MCCAVCVCVCVCVCVHVRGRRHALTLMSKSGKYLKSIMNRQETKHKYEKQEIPLRTKAN